MPSALPESAQARREIRPKSQRPSWMRALFGSSLGPLVVIVRLSHVCLKQFLLSTHLDFMCQVRNQKAHEHAGKCHRSPKGPCECLHFVFCVCLTCSGLLHAAPILHAFSHSCSSHSRQQSAAWATMIPARMSLMPQCANARMPRSQQCWPVQRLHVIPPVTKL